jgi:hypothetical protein
LFQEEITGYLIDIKETGTFQSQMAGKFGLIMTA